MKYYMLIITWWIDIWMRKYGFELAYLKEKGIKNMFKEIGNKFLIFNLCYCYCP